MILKILAILLLFICNLNAINISDTGKKHNVLGDSSVYFDEFNVEDIDSIDEQIFTEYKTNKVDLGLIKSSLWIKIDLLNDTLFEIERNLYFDNFALDYITLYVKNNDRYREYNEGVFREREFDNIVNPYFSISLKPKEEKVLFLKVKSNTTALNFKLYLLTNNQLHIEESNKQLILSLFLGGLIALILYNTFIYFFTKDLAYFFYVLYIFTFTIGHSYLTGMHLFLVNGHFEYLLVRVFVIMTIFLLIFIKVILNLKKYKYINYGIHGFVSILLLLFVILSKDFYPVPLAMSIMLSAMFYILFVCFYLIRETREVRYIIVGWVFAIFGFLMLAFYANAIFDYKDYFPYLFEACIFLEATLFSMALASKLNRTSELEEAFERNRTLTKELHHRVKNNMQFIVSMYRLKLAKELSENSLSKLREVENTIYAMSKTHELLYSKNEFEYISTKDYFQELVSEIKKGFESNKIDISLDISVDLSLKEAINCGIILNEAITNSLKHAFKGHRGFIHIKIIQILEKKVFIIEDNGVGFSQSQKSSSFGLLLINSLVTDELKGNIVIESNNGTRIIIEF